MAAITSRLRLFLTPKTPNYLKAVTSSYSSFKTSPFVSDLPEPTIKYEVSSDPQEWSFVERILPVTVVPKPEPKPEYSSNWKPQAPAAFAQPYFIQRTKNHMLPVYLDTTNRGMRGLTYIRKVKGDVWLLEKDVREFLEKATEKPVRTQVNEFVGYICVHGDHVNAVKDFLMKKSF